MAFAASPASRCPATVGFGAPQGTPAAVIEKLNAALGDTAVQARMADLGGTALPGSPADFARLIAQETESWGKAAQFSDAKAS